MALNLEGSLPVASMEQTWNMSWLWVFSLAPLSDFVSIFSPLSPCLWFSLSLCFLVPVSLPMCHLSAIFLFFCPSVSVSVSLFVGEKGSFLFHSFLLDTKNKWTKAIYLRYLNESCWILTPPSSHVGRESNRAFRVEPQRGSFCPVSLAPVEQAWVWFRSKGKFYSLIKEWRVWAYFPWKVAGAYAFKRGASSSISEMESQDGDVLT